VLQAGGVEGGSCEPVLIRELRSNRSPWLRAVLRQISSIANANIGGANSNHAPPSRFMPAGDWFQSTLRCNSRQFEMAKRIRRDGLPVVFDKAKQTYSFRLDGICWLVVLMGVIVLQRKPCLLVAKKPKRVPSSRGQTQKSAPTVPGHQGFKPGKWVLADPLLILNFA
jgi:hypothetical protein